MRYKVTLAYVGSNYHGFVHQINAITIQDKIEHFLAIIFQKEIKIVVASRTDVGVHAYGQVFHFDAPIKNIGQLKWSLNSLLPKDIRILKVELVDSSFHARFSVKQKTYRYLINCGEYDPFYEKRAFQKKYQLDYQKMLQVAKLFIGEHDFTSFNTTPLKEKPCQVRIIKEFKIEKKKQRYLITVTGNGFLRHMVRIMVGTLVEVGRHKMSIEEAQNLLTHPTKSKRRYNIDAGGLYLVKIEY